MATVAAFLSGFRVTGAHRAIADLRLSPVNGVATFSAKFLRSLATGTNSTSASLTRTIGGGQQFTSIGVSERTMGTRDVLMGTFTQRAVSYSVTDRYENNAYWRTLTISVRTLDAAGVDETWSLDLSIDEPADTLSDFNIQSGTAPAVVRGVNATP